MLAFDAAALLYLVVEKLLFEAHKQAQAQLLAAMFFVGSLLNQLLAGLVA